jgi:hypothetical protein
MGKIIQFLIKQSTALLSSIIPFLAANTSVDIDTVNKSDGKYLRVRVEIKHFKIVDEYIKIGEQQTVDWYNGPEYKAALQEIEKHASKSALETLKLNPKN